MSICAACGGVIGRDCFNPTECMEITRDMAMRSQQPDQRDEQIIALTRQNAALRQSLERIHKAADDGSADPVQFRVLIRAEVRQALSQPSAGGAA